MTSLQRFNRDYRTEFNVMVIGIPNVGKSSLINALRAAIVQRVSFKTIDIVTSRTY